MNRLELKENAKQSIRNASPNPTRITFIFFMITIAISLPYTILSGRNIAQSGYEPVEFSFFILIVLIITQFVVYILSFGYAAYCLGISKNQSMGYKNLFDGFYQSGKVILLSILMGIFVFLWALLLGVPGIVAAYRYRQAYFIMIENPQISPMDALRASKEMMKGRKMDLFILDLSFIGWAFLCGLTFGILYFWKMPYFAVTYGNFYRKISLKEQA